MPLSIAIQFRKLFPCLIPALFVIAGGLSAEAQLTRGYGRTAPAEATIEEKSRQRDLWMMEVQMKPMRMVWTDVVDPASGETRKEQVWYLAWRAIRRPVDTSNGNDTYPVNVLEPLPGPLKFIPEFTLVAYDNPASEFPVQVLQDQILPNAMRQIRSIERANQLDSVSVVQDLPEPTPADAEEQPWIYGAATWRGVDPDTDFFKVILSGFSNGYDMRKGEDDSNQVWRKVLVQRFVRPGDRYDPNQREFDFSGQPEWIYRPESQLAEQPAPGSEQPQP